LLFSVLKNIFSTIICRSRYGMAISCACLCFVFSHAYAEEENKDVDTPELTNEQKYSRDDFVYSGGVFIKGNEAPKIVVNKFVINGVIDRPDQDITRESIEIIVEEMRVAETDGFSIEEFKKITDAITFLYRKAGFFLARAFIPEQDVENATVQINIIEGVLDKVIFQDNVLYTDKQLTKYFKPLMGKPVLKETLESSLLKVGDYPGLDATGLFQPGDEAGKTNLLFKAQDERRFENSLWIDNAGAEFTGKTRVMLRVFANNLTKNADALNFNVLKTFSPTNSTYWSFNYEHPFSNSAFFLGLGYSNNAFVVGQFLTDLNVEGSSNITNFYIRNNFVRSRNLNFGSRFELTQKNSESNQDVSSIGEDHLTVMIASLDFNFNDKLLGGHNQATFQYSKGLPELLGAMDENGDGVSSRTGASGDRAGGDFQKINFSYLRVQPFKSITSNNFFKNQSLLFRLNMQQSKDLLTSMEQYPLGGPNNVRAYPSSEKLADTATFFSTEWIARAADVKLSEWLQGMQLSVFIDYANGKINEPLTNDPGSINLSGIGGAVQVSPKNGKYEFRLDIAKALSSEEPSNEQSIQFFFKFGYRF